jgi:hypothetical protein
MTGVAGIEVVNALQTSEKGLPGPCKLSSNFYPKTLDTRITGGALGNELYNLSIQDRHLRAPHERGTVRTLMHDHVNRYLNILATAVTTNTGWHPVYVGSVQEEL